MSGINLDYIKSKIANEIDIEPEHIELVPLFNAKILQVFLSKEVEDDNLSDEL